MTIIRKIKANIINRGLTSIFLVICFLSSLIQSQEAYAEMKKVSGTSKTIARLAQTPIAVAGSPAKGILRVFNSVLSSADPDWNDACFFYVEYAESTKDWGEKGYGVITHPGGDQTFIRFMSKLTSTAGSESTGEWEGLFLGGSGKFKDIRARWLLKWKRIMTEGRVAEWEVEYY
jgi:hypothetical protein